MRSIKKRMRRWTPTRNFCTPTPECLGRSTRAVAAAAVAEAAVGAGAEAAIPAAARAVVETLAGVARRREPRPWAVTRSYRAWARREARRWWTLWPLR